MELEHVRTVELLAAKVANWGLPPDDDREDEAAPDDNNLLAGTLAETLSEVKSRETELIEAQHPPEVAALRLNMQRLRVLRERVDACKERMAELRGAYQSVSGRTSSLHDACDRALAEQTALSTGSHLIKTNLYYFKQADAIMKKLSVAKLMVTGQSFAAMLASIDECLSFLRAHNEYRESATYIAKFEQCLSRAMTWAQLQVDYEKIGRSGADEDTFALLYGVFASRAASVKGAISVMEQRFWNVPEFEEMLAECQYAYFAKRQLLLAPILQSTLAALSTTHAESTCRLTRDACTFILRTCDDEYRLYRQFFINRGANRDEAPESPTTPAPSVINHSVSKNAADVHPFEGFTESLCRLLYDMLRPRIIHNPYLETLAELCTMLKVDMIENRCSLEVVATMIGDFDILFNPRAGFVAVMSELVGDIAERIVYRAGLYAQNDIAAYRPAPGDVAYPQMLQMMRQIDNEQKLKAQNEEPEEPGKIRLERKSSSSVAAIDQHCLWYPTVRRTVMCLSKLFSCLDVGVFHSLARDMLLACCESLEIAAQAISAQPAVVKGGRSKQLDAELFVVKHLLILREQTSPYRHASRSDSSLPTKDFSIDFSKFTNILFDQKARWFELSSNNSLLELLTTVPIEVKENEGDSRRVIDIQLRAACFKLTNTASKMMVGRLAAWIDSAEDEKLKSDFDLSKQPQLAAAQLRDIAAESYKLVGSRFPEIREAYSLYIGVAETETILLSPVRKRVIDVFSRVNSFAAKAYDDDSKAVAALASVQQLLLLLNKQ
ncbi:unnamed protein product [Caenorhabditis auriculariae]|uniref:Conserved oligomeric Golgi complex subunit 3 n=1 Tax=Caenorhabditis auriculariae TaxID=2777116 RepID=A0A8S1HYN5_9PELO|nr:unnamed protein product [Caenorhabditis auriculariae]